MNEDKKTRKAPAFQLYTDDFLAGTIEMSQEEVGQFIRLLCHQWNRGSIPVETEKQQRLAGGCVSVDVLDKFDHCEDGLLRNKRLESVRTEKGKFLQSQSAKGKLSAEKRRLEALERQTQSNQNLTAVEPVLQPDDQPDTQPEFNSPSPSPNKRDTTSPKSPWDVGFGVELPNSFQTENCLQAVKLWLQYKSERKEGYKKTGLTASLTKWSNEFSPAEFPSAVENSIASGWKGIFPTGKQQQQPQAKSVNLSLNIADYQ
jgi:uncharacterized protein YdaU (DUF1376 family)